MEEWQKILLLDSETKPCVIIARTATASNISLMLHYQSLTLSRCPLSVAFVQFKAIAQAKLQQVSGCLY
eukprot:scaffold5762_cov94-Skeletonema_marinoi.AAC.3